MQRKNSNRMNKVDEEFKREIGKIIDQDLKNPNITGLISVTKVKTSSDLKSARVYISIINSKSKKNTLVGLKNATGFIRSELAKRVNLRYTPELIFEIDDTLEYGAKIDNILKEIMPKE
jgi:ribosome-binding factor A